MTLRQLFAEVHSDWDASGLFATPIGWMLRDAVLSQAQNHGADEARMFGSMLSVWLFVAMEERDPDARDASLYPVVTAKFDDSVDSDRGNALLSSLQPGRFGYAQFLADTEQGSYNALRLYYIPQLTTLRTTPVSNWRPDPPTAVRRHRIQSLRAMVEGLSSVNHDLNIYDVQIAFAYLLYAEKPYDPKVLTQLEAGDFDWSTPIWEAVSTLANKPFPSGR